MFRNQYDNEVTVWSPQGLGAPVDVPAPAPGRAPEAGTGPPKRADEGVVSSLHPLKGASQRVITPNGTRSTTSQRYDLRLRARLPPVVEGEVEPNEAVKKTQNRRSVRRKGRLHQVEYAMEAVKQGSATVGLKSKDYAILVALKRASSELSAHQKKIIHIDDHVGMTIAGLTADAHVLSRFMRSECLSNRYSHDAPLPVSRLAKLLGNKMQVCTQRYDRRPFGVGLLIAGYDDGGPHLYQTCPSANYFDCKAMALGARSQSAKTYLEKHLDELKECSRDELIKHGLRALRDTLPNEEELTTKNCSLAVVGKDLKFTIYDDDAIAPFLAGIEGEERTRRLPPPPDANLAPMDEDKQDQPPTEPAPDNATDEQMQLD